METSRKIKDYKVLTATIAERREFFSSIKNHVNLYGYELHGSFSVFQKEGGDVHMFQAMVKYES